MSTKYQPRLSLPRPSHVESKANQLQKGFLDEKNAILFGGGFKCEFSAGVSWQQVT